MRPAPTTPSVLRQRRLPSSSEGSQPVKRPSREQALALDHAARGGEGQRDGELRGRLGEDARRVADGDPERGRAGHVDVVVADGVVGEHPSAGGGQAFEQLRVPAFGELGEHAVAARADGRDDLLAGERPLGRRRPRRDSRRRPAARASVCREAAWSRPRESGRSGDGSRTARRSKSTPLCQWRTSAHGAHHGGLVNRSRAARGTRLRTRGGAGGPSGRPRLRQLPAWRGAYLPSRASIFLTPSEASSA